MMLAVWVWDVSRFGVGRHVRLHNWPPSNRFKPFSFMSFQSFMGEKQLTSNTGTSKKKGNIESMLSKFKNWKRTPHGVGGGVGG